VGFNYPRGLALDESEDLIYVADTGNNRIKLFNTEGTPIQTVGGRGDRPGEFDNPIGLAVGAAGRLYVADSQNYRIQVFDRGFRFVESWGRRGTQTGDFAHPPTNLALTVNGEAVVCDDTERMMVFGDAGAYLGSIAPPRGASPVPKFYTAAFAEGEELLAVDENGCQVHQFLLKEKSA
jgi:DNA-binding beta-propeller fold protein YncE